MLNPKFNKLNQEERITLYYILNNKKAEHEAALYKGGKCYRYHIEELQSVNRILNKIKIKV